MRTLRQIWGRLFSKATSSVLRVPIAKIKFGKPKNKRRYFKLREFESPDSPGSGVRMNFKFVDTLEIIRGKYGKPMKVNSGYRTPAHNKSVGGVLDSSHPKGLAADIRIYTSQDRFKLVSVALACGIKRIGIGQTFIHLDADTTKPQNVIWIY